VAKTMSSFPWICNLFPKGQQVEARDVIESALAARFKIPLGMT